jgi:hypothetical protein
LVTGEPRGLDDTYGEVLAELSGSARELGDDLLGLVNFRPGASRWEDAIRLEACRHLPIFAAETLPLARRALVDAFLAAHHRSLFYGVLADRLADGQLAETPALRTLEAALLDAWRRGLATALGDPLRAETIVESATDDALIGLGIQRRAFSEGRMNVEDYRRLILLKLGWSIATADALVGSDLPSRVGSPFATSARLLLIALQCVDDTLDVDEDRALTNHDIPSMLGISSVTMRRAASYLLWRASDIAREGGFESFADWLSRHGDVVYLSEPHRVDLAQELEAMALARDME